MHEGVQRPDYVDVEDMELRDIWHRLDVLDHKLDTVLSRLDGQAAMIGEPVVVLQNHLLLMEKFYENAANVESRLQGIESRLDAQRQEFSESDSVWQLIVRQMHLTNEGQSADVKPRLQAIEDKQTIVAGELAIVVAALRISDSLLRSIHAKVGADDDARIDAMLDDIARNA